MTTNNISDKKNDKKYSFKEYYDMGIQMVKEDKGDIEKDVTTKDINKD